MVDFLKSFFPRERPWDIFFPNSTSKILPVPGLAVYTIFLVSLVQALSLASAISCGGRELGNELGVGLLVSPGMSAPKVHLNREPRVLEVS